MSSSKKFKIITGKSVILTAFIFVGSYLTVFIIFPYSFWTEYFSTYTSGILLDIFINLIFCVVIAESSLFIDHLLNKKVSWTLQPLKRLLLQILFQVLLVLSSIIVIVIIMQLFVNTRNPKPYHAGSREGLYIIISIIVLTLMISALNTGNFLIRNWQIAIIKAADYKVKIAQNKQLLSETELHALKLQLDPHFAFNSLSVLSELILKDQQLAYKYSENFAKVYRYLLINSKNRLITVNEELKFLNAYLFLIKNRVGDGSKFMIEVCKSKLGMMIPPATLQLLIENALKHNRTEEDNPLIINIYTNEDNELVVSNQLLPLKKQISSTGIGLTNITSRYELLGDKKPSIEQNNKTFIVKLPLI